MKKGLYYYALRAYRRILRELRATFAPKTTIFVPSQKIDRPTIDRHAYHASLRERQRKHQRHEQHK